MHSAKYLIIGCLFFCLFLASCGGGGSSSAPSAPVVQASNISVSTSPTPASVQVGRTLQMTATVSGTTTATVSWSVNSVAGGNATVGTINASGLFTAPNSVPSPATVNVTATSTVDATKSSPASVTITPATAPAGSWNRIAPFSGVGQLAVDPRSRNVLFLATANAGIFKSSDTGQTWVPLIGPAVITQNDVQIPSVAVGSVSSTLYFVSGAVPNPAKLYTSFDQGTTLSSRALPSDIAGSNLELDSHNDQNLLLWSSVGISKSTDGGATWTRLANAPSSARFVRVDHALSSTIYAGTTAGFFISQDGGASWSLQNSGIDPAFLVADDLAIDPANPARMYLATEESVGFGGFQGHVFRSTDSGHTWTRVTGPAGVQPILGLQIANANTLYASINTFNFGGTPLIGVIKSTDGGANWTPVGTGLSAAHSGNLLLANVGPDTLFFSPGGPKGPFKSVDGGATWIESSNGLFALFGNHISVDPTTSTTLYMGGFNGGGFWKSVDSGFTWSLLLDDSATSFAVDPHDSNHILVSNSQPYILETLDGGISWHQNTTPAGSIFSIAFSLKSPGTVFGCLRLNGIIRSNDNGVTWSPTNTGLGSLDCHTIVADPQAAQTVFAATLSGIYKSTDGGSSWTLKKTGDAVGFYPLIIDPQNNQIIYSSDFTNYIRSIDGGNTWSTMNPGFSPAVSAALALDPQNHLTIFASTFNNAVAISTDGGITWAQTNNGLGFAQITDITVVPNTTKIFVTTFNNGMLAFR